jgi:hypothetical protein
VATVRKPETVIIELTPAELELIRAGLRAYREYRSTAEDDDATLALLSDLEAE